MQVVNSPLNGVADGNIDLRGCLYEKDQLFAADIPALKASYINGLTLTDCRFDWDKAVTQPYFTHAIEVAHFSNVVIRNCKGTAAPAHAGVPLLSLKEGSAVATDLPKTQVSMSGVK